MASTFQQVIDRARKKLDETTPRFWSDAELLDDAIAAAKDLWRDIVDLKGEHYLTKNTADVTLPSNTSTLSGVPTNVHKIYLIEPTDTSANSANVGLEFKPLDYNNPKVIRARAADDVEAANNIIYYSISGQGAPVGAPTIDVAPQVTSTVNLRFVYIPTLGNYTFGSEIPVPAEADTAIMAWIIAWARMKERDDRAPDAALLNIYSTEKQHLLQSLGLRQYQELEFVPALFEEYW